MSPALFNGSSQARAGSCGGPRPSDGGGNRRRQPSTSRLSSSQAAPPRPFPPPRPSSTLKNKLHELGPAVYRLVKAHEAEESARRLHRYGGLDNEDGGATQRATEAQRRAAAKKALELEDVRRELAGLTAEALSEFAGTKLEGMIMRGEVPGQSGESLSAEAYAQSTAFARLQAENTSLQSELSSLRTDNAALRSEQSTLSERFSALEKLVKDQQQVVPPPAPSPQPVPPSAPIGEYVPKADFDTLIIKFDRLRRMVETPAPSAASSSSTCLIACFGLATPALAAQVTTLVERIAAFEEKERKRVETEAEAKKRRKAEEAVEVEREKVREAEKAKEGEKMEVDEKKREREKAEIEKEALEKVDKAVAEVDELKKEIAKLKEELTAEVERGVQIAISATEGLETLKKLPALTVRIISLVFSFFPNFSARFAESVLLFLFRD
ncbi:hypothetical protein JCM8547_006137 [Rhodosporidiobolus lusitaniae]